MKKPRSRKIRQGESLPEKHLRGDGAGGASKE